MLFLDRGYRHVFYLVQESELAGVNPSIFLRVLDGYVLPDQASFRVYVHFFW